MLVYSLKGVNILEPVTACTSINVCSVVRRGNLTTRAPNLSYAYQIMSVIAISY